MRASCAHHQRGTIATIKFGMVGCVLEGSDGTLAWALVSSERQNARGRHSLNGARPGVKYM
jgi:hypothetical protein